MKKALYGLLIFLCLDVAVFAQAVTVTASAIKIETVSGTCRAGQIRLYVDGTLKVCASGTWASSGGGTTINSTNGYVPYRVNSTTFGNSAFTSNALNSTYLAATSGASGAGLILTVTGGGTDEDLTLTPKGAGVVKFSGAGSVSAPTIRFAAASGVAGFYNPSSNDLGIVTNGAEYVRYSPGGIIYRSDAVLVWSTGTGTLTSFDFGLARPSSGVGRITNASTGPGKLLIGASTDSATGCQLCIYPASSTEAGLKLSALTGTSASQQVFQSYNAAGATLTYAVRADGVEFQNGVTFANLPGTPSNGMYLYCSDCTVTSGADNTATSGGSGAFVVRLNGVWRAFNTQN